MIVENKMISEVIMDLGKHYKDNVSTRFLRPLFSEILADTSLSRRISDITEHSQDFLMQGYHLNDLYMNILALAQFVFLVRRDVLPNLSSLTEENTRFATSDKVYRTMAFNNLPANIRILADYINDLYVLTISYDKKNSLRGCVADTIPELELIGKYLIENH